MMQPLRPRSQVARPATSWQARATFDGLAPGSHALEVRVLPRKNAASSDYYVDLDRLIVE